VNPDFGQVEIDPAVVNLTDVESFFQEKRPFFTEGVSVFRCGNNGANDYWGFNWPEPVFFYSRRIGRTPQGDTPAAEFTETPLATHILGAAKITGQTAPGWNVGTVQAVTRREEATLQNGGVESAYGVEPMTYYGVYRFMHEMNDRRQGLGLMATTTAAFFEGDHDPLRDQVNDGSVVTTMDGWTFLDQKRVWVVSGYGTGSWVHGSTTRMTSLQQSFPHYYQRPDRPGLGVDPDAQSLAGWGGRLWLNKQQGAFLFNSAFGALSSGYNNNDLGFQFGGDIVNGHIGMGHQWEKPNGWRQYANVLAAVASTWDFGGNNTLHGAYLSGSLEQRNRWSWWGNTFVTGESMDSRKTRGGPVMVRNKAASFNAGFDTNGQKPWFWSISVSPYVSADGSWEQQVTPSIRWRPVPNLGLSGGPDLYKAHYDSQFWDNEGTLATGSRFAELEQTQWSMIFRMDYAATPNLSPAAVRAAAHLDAEVSRAEGTGSLAHVRVRAGAGGDGLRRDVRFGARQCGAALGVRPGLERVPGVVAGPCRRQQRRNVPPGRVLQSGVERARQQRVPDQGGAPLPPLAASSKQGATGSERGRIAQPADRPRSVGYRPPRITSSMPGSAPPRPARLASASGTASPSPGARNRFCSSPCWRSYRSR
jgi:hypothetical protein